MPPLLRNILAVVSGVILGSMSNMGLVSLGHGIIPTGLLFPFLAHALGTLVGAAVAARIATDHGMRYALGIGAWFFLGGLTAVFLIKAPLWFAALDLSLAYFPMAWIGGKLAARRDAVGVTA